MKRKRKKKRKRGKRKRKRKRMLAGHHMAIQYVSSEP
jgi:hypothetical protein